MKRTITLLFTLLFACVTGLDTLAGQASFPSGPRNRYVIKSDIDLGGKTIALSRGAKLVIKRGSLSNGTIKGDASTIQVSGTGAVFKNVTLAGTWKGKATDAWFDFDPSANHWSLINGLCRFNEVVLTHSHYNIRTWKLIDINSSGMVFDGKGATLTISGDKGTWEQTKWGKRYKVWTLFNTSVGNGSDFTIRNLSIKDSHGTFMVYDYFNVTGRHVLFQNVQTDGGGCMEHVYNIGENIESIVFENCEIRTDQFAFEMGTIPYKNSHPTCERVEFRNCKLYQYKPQIYVGLLSIVGDTPTGSLLITDSEFDALEREGNLEVISVRNIVISNCRFKGQFLCSEDFGRIEKYQVSGCTFEFGKHNANISYKFGGREVDFHDNILRYTSDDIGFLTVTDQVRNLRFYNNRIDCSAIASSPGNTTLALSKLNENKARVYMEGNTFIGQPGVSGRNFVFRMPYVLYADKNNTFHGRLDYRGYRRSVATVPDKPSIHTIKVKEDFPEKVLTLALSLQVTNASSKQDILDLSGSGSTWEIGYFKGNLTLSSDGKIQASVPIASKSSDLDIVFSLYDSQNVRVLVYDSERCILDTVTAVTAFPNVNLVTVHPRNGFSIKNLTINRGGVLQ